jgi:uncharacterized protein (TIGR00251 family)
LNPISATPGGVAIRVHVQPRASRTEILGLHGDAIKIRLAAAPVDGAANDALIRLLASLLGVPRSAVTVTSGRSGRRKMVSVAGVTPSQVAQAFGLEL